jgi:hypothetical protein
LIDQIRGAEERDHRDEQRDDPEPGGGVGGQARHVSALKNSIEQRRPQAALPAANLNE